MNLAREINKKLDAILAHKRQAQEIKEKFKDPDFVLEDMETGKLATQEEVLNTADAVYAKIISELDEITNNGQNCRDMFTNQYYINDMSQDKLITEEIMANKLNTELDKQNSKIN